MSPNAAPHGGGNPSPEDGSGEDGRLSGKTVSDGRFRLESFIGGGSFGAVYRGLDLQLGGPVAIKLSTGPGVSENAFRREAKLLHSIQHPNVVRVLAYGKSDDLGAHYIVMEYLDGTPLEKLLEKGPLSSEQLAELALQIGDALESVHHQKTAHRDLSANNILRINIPVQSGRTRRVPWRFVLIDFGISAKFDAQKSLGASTTQGFGTPEYMPPEMLKQTNEGELDFKTAVGVDIYGFGTILYRALTGKKPFALKKNSMDGLVQLVSEINNVPALAPSAISSDARVTPEIDELILSCLAKDSELRPRSPYQVGEDLAHFLSTASRTGPLPQYAKVESERSRAANWIKVGAALFCVVLIVGVVVISRRGEKADRLVSPQMPGTTPAPVNQLKVYPSSVELKAGEEKEIEIWMTAPSGLEQALPSSGLEVQLLPILDKQGHPVTGVSLGPEERLPSGKRKHRIYSDLNVPDSTGMLKVSLSDPESAPTTQSVEIKVRPADYWKPSSLPENIRWENVGRLSRIENYPGIYAEEIQVIHPELSEPVRFRLVFEPTAKPSNRPHPFYMMVNKVTRRDFRCFLKGDDVRWTSEEGDPIEGNDLFPATDVTLNEAYRYSQWLCGTHATIPSFKEWTTAAGFSHPERPPGPYAPEVEEAPPKADLGRVGIDFPLDISKYGIREMAVNGKELTRTFTGQESIQFPVEDGTHKRVVVLGAEFDKKDPENNTRGKIDHENPGSAETNYKGGLAETSDPYVSFRVVVVLYATDTQPDTDGSFE